MKKSTTAIITNSVVGAAMTTAFVGLYRDDLYLLFRKAPCAELREDKKSVIKGVISYGSSFLTIATNVNSMITGHYIRIWK